jgi:choline dehydrogenase
VVNPNYLQHEADLQTFVEALNIIRRIADSPAFSDLNGGELVPGRDGDVEQHARNMCSTLWHPAGTCQMGTGSEAVVDPELRVKGVSGLRVVDASVMPIVTSGNTLAGCYMIAEKAADFILNES